MRTVMREMGTAMMGTGHARGDDRAEEAAEKAISSPLLEDVDLAGARGILVNITAGMDMIMEEFEIVGNAVRAFASENATVVVGAVIDPNMGRTARDRGCDRHWPGPQAGNHAGEECPEERAPVTFPDAG